MGPWRVMRKETPTPIEGPARAGGAPAEGAVSSEPLSAVDRAWLEMDEVNNPMIVAAILEFEDVDDARALGELILARLCRHARFRQRVVARRRSPPCWVEDDALHAGYHLRCRDLAEPDAAGLRAALAEEMSRDLDRAMPLWRLTVFPLPGRRATVLFRAHHALADGIALLHLLDLHAEPRAPKAPRAARRGPLAGLIGRLESLNDVLEATRALVADDLRHPEQLARHVRETRRTLAAVARVMALPDDNPAALRARLSGRRAVAWRNDLSLATVRRLAHAQSATLNDVFLATLAGAFGRYFRDTEGSVPEGQNLRVSVPVNLRHDGDTALGNHFGLVMLDLPVGVEGWHARLELVSERMARLKRSPEARAVLLALGVAGTLPTAAEKQLVRRVAGKAGAVVSNLAGPRRRMKFDGMRLAGMVFWPPQAACVGVGVSLLSYAGRLGVGVSSDTAQIAHPLQVVDAFCAELQAMLGGRAAGR
jgi:diacylglycerol O-acyltransferase / wax synthase